MDVEEPITAEMTATYQYSTTWAPGLFSDVGLAAEDPRLISSPLAVVQLEAVDRQRAVCVGY